MVYRPPQEQARARDRYSPFCPEAHTATARAAGDFCRRGGRRGGGSDWSVAISTIRRAQGKERRRSSSLCILLSVLQMAEFGVNLPNSLRL